MIGERVRQLKRLTEVPSVSGNEIACGKLLKRQLEKLADNVYVDEVGNVVARKGKPKTWVFAHMDTIGFVVSDTREGNPVRVVSARGKEDKIPESGWKVVVQGKRQIPGKLHGSESENKLTVDLKDGTSDLVSVGNFVSIAKNFRAGNDRVTSPSLDNKMGVAAALAVFKAVDNIGLVATVQEESTKLGATKAAWDLMPQEIIVLDVTYDENPEVDYPVHIGQGPVICLKDSLFPDRKMIDKLIAAAQEVGVPFQFEILESAGSDANAVYTAWGHTPFAFVGIPIQKMHTPDEVGSIQDLENTIKLLVTFFENNG